MQAYQQKMEKFFVSEEKKFGRIDSKVHLSSIYFFRTSFNRFFPLLNAFLSLSFLPFLFSFNDFSNHFFVHNLKYHKLNLIFSPPLSLFSIPILYLSSLRVKNDDILFFFIRGVQPELRMNLFDGS